VRADVIKDTLNLRLRVTHGFQNCTKPHQLEHVQVTNSDSTECVEAKRFESSHHHAWNFQAQVLRVLMCTARLLANSPGGLRFKAGTRPWLIPLTSDRRSY